MNRRELLRSGVSMGAGVLAALADTRTPPSLPPYVDRLPIPPVLRPPLNGGPIDMRRGIRHKVHRDLPPTSLWGYNSMWPGPTLEVQKGQPLSVRWKNELPTKHFLPIDTTIHGAEASLPKVRTVVHVHGARVLPESDGYPDAWFTADGKAGARYDSGSCHYPNDQQATLLWYHDHAIGITRLNIYAGLAGFYVIRDPQEEALNLPGGQFEIPLMIQDRKFNPDGSLLYPVARNGTHPVWIQEFFGETVCVNGKAAPFLEVEPRKYRLRMVNGSNSRFYHLSLVTADAAGNPAGEALGPAFHQIGTDSGLLPAPVTLRYLILAPGERFDIIADFAEFKGANFALLNDAPAPYTRGGEVGASQVMLFKVTEPFSGKDTSALPDTLAEMPLLNPAGGQYAKESSPSPRWTALPTATP